MDYPLRGWGEPLKLPGQFHNIPPHSPDFLEQLRQSITRFEPPAVRPVTEAEPSKMEADLQKASFMYIKRGTTSSALSLLYQGPYKMLTWGAKVFQVDVGGRKEVISAVRLKPHMGTSLCTCTAGGASEERAASSQRSRGPRTASGGSCERSPQLGGGDGQCDSVRETVVSWRKNICKNLQLF